MKFSLFLMISIFCVNLSFAQSSDSKGKEIKSLTEKLGLNERQEGKIATIIQRKYDSFQDVQQYKASDAKKYTAKLKAIYEGTIHSVQLLLENDAQKEAFRQYRIALRKQKAQIVKKYKDGGLTPEEASNKYYKEVFFS